MPWKQWLPLQLTALFKVSQGLAVKKTSFAFSSFILAQNPAGAATVWAFYFMIIGWFFHICVVVFKLVCPILALRSKKYSKWIHLCLLTIGKLTHIFLHMWRFIHNYVYTYKHTYTIHTAILMYLDIYAITCICTYIHTYIYAHMYECMEAIILQYIV